MARALGKDFNEVYRVFLQYGKPDEFSFSATWHGPWASVDIARQFLADAVYRLMMSGHVVDVSRIESSGEFEWKEISRGSRSR